MSRVARHWGLLSLGFLFTACLVYLGQDWGPESYFSMLLVPLICLAGYWEDLRGVVVFMVAAVILTIVAQAAGYLSREAALIHLLIFGLTLALAAFILRDDADQFASWEEERAPLEAKLHKVERKVRLIRAETAEYELRLKNLAQLYATAKKLMGYLELVPLVDEARTLTAKSLPRHFGPQVETEARLGIYLPENEKGDFKRLGSPGHEVPDEGLPEAFDPQKLREWLGATLSPVRVRDLARDPRWAPLGQDSGLRSLLLIPLVMRDALIGILVLASEQANAFLPVEYNQAGVLGKQIVFALRKALLYRKVQALSITDNLTGLYVHRHFQERFSEELHRAERYRHFLSLILLDLDNFKRVNDTHGHPTGDAVLAEAAARIREASGPTALVARYGGEEFAVLLPNAAKARALQIAERINTLLKATPIDLGGTRMTITISGGVTTYPEDALTREALITAADSSLYEAKRNGRDLIMGYSR